MFESAPKQKRRLVSDEELTKVFAPQPPPEIQAPKVREPETEAPKIQVSEALKAVEIPSPNVLGPGELAMPKLPRRRRSERRQLRPVLDVPGASAGGGFLGEELEIPEGVEKICEREFMRSPNLRKVILPRSLKYIGKEAFANCPELVEVNFPSGLKLIDDMAFYTCSSLKKVVIPGSVERVGSHAFFRCSELEVLEIREGVHQLGRAAFGDCRRLTNFHERNLPRSLERTIDFGRNRYEPVMRGAFEGSPCVETRESKRKRKAAKRWDGNVLIMQRIL